MDKESILKKLSNPSGIFKWSGVLLFILLVSNAVSILINEGWILGKIQIILLIFFGIIFIPIFYVIGLMFKKIEDKKWFDRILIEIKTGLQVGFSLTIITLIMMFIVYSFSFPNKEFLFNNLNTWYLLIFRIIMPIFILFFICGVIIGFISRIIYFFLTGRFTDKK